MLQSLTNIQRQVKSRHREVNMEGSRNNAIRRKMYSSGSSDSKGSIEGSSSSSHTNKRKRRYRDGSRDEFQKEIPPTFNGEVNTSQAAKDCLLRMKKYFQVQGYSGNTKERVAILDMNGRE